MAFWIQGSFFQKRQWLGTTVVPVEGTVSVIHGGLCRFMYSGEIWPDPASTSGELTGQMQDALGLSVLSEIVVSATEVRFTKKYEHKKGDLVRYAFRQKYGNMWIGEYVVESGGTGASCCLITKVGTVFLTPESITKLLDRKKPSSYVWGKGRRPGA